MAADFNSSVNKIKIMYNDVRANYAKPISLSYVTNAILKALAGPDYSIEMSIQSFYKMSENKKIDIKVAFIKMNTYFIPLIIACFLFPAVAFFILHPLQEKISNIKHLQRMTGVTAFNYWGTMFIFDFAIMIVLSSIIVIGLIIIDIIGGLELIKATEICEYYLFIYLFKLINNNL